MDFKYIVSTLLALYFSTCFAFTCLAQSTSNCVVTEKQGSLVTVICAGEGTKIINMGGSADIYKPGDSITIGKDNKNRRERRNVR